MLRWERLEGGSGQRSDAAWPQPPGSGCLCLQEAYESAVEYFGENPKTSPPTTFFPMFMRFIRAYKVGGDGGVSCFWGLGGDLGLGGLTPPWDNQQKPHERRGLQGRETLGLGAALWGGRRCWSWVGVSWGLPRRGRGGCSPTGGPPWLRTSSLHFSQESRAGHRTVEETRGRSQRSRIWLPWQRGPA